MSRIHTRSYQDIYLYRRSSGASGSFVGGAFFCLAGMAMMRYIHPVREQDEVYAKQERPHIEK